MSSPSSPLPPELFPSSTQRDPRDRDVPPRSRERLTSRRSWILSGILFVLTFFTTTTMGPFWTLVVRTDVMTDLPEFLTLESIRRVWGNPELLKLGLSFSLPVLLILLAHELGHYLTCRRYRLRATPPYFLPLPLALGTLGAFIRIKSPIRNKRELFDVGVAGPLAGFAVLLPFLFYGVAHSTPAAIQPISEASQPLFAPALFLPGSCLALEAVTWLFHGPLPDDTVLNLHPFALASWIGLFVTALNLLPLAQLDGGHILYSVSARAHRVLGRWLWVALLAGTVLWPGWAVWAILVLILGLRHPPLREEGRPLQGSRRTLAVVALLLFLACFMPKPLEIVPLAI